MLGEPVEYHYYSNEATGQDYWFEACADYMRRGWFVRQCTAPGAMLPGDGQAGVRPAGRADPRPFRPGLSAHGRASAGFPSSREHRPAHAALSYRWRQMGSLDARRDTFADCPRPTI